MDDFSGRDILLHEVDDVWQDAELVDRKPARLVVLYIVVTRDHHLTPQLGDSLVVQHLEVLLNNTSREVSNRPDLKAV